MLTELETAMVKAGWVRCPNSNFEWYPGYAGKREPVFPLCIHVTDAIWLVTDSYGMKERHIPLMRFENVESLEAYLVTNGREAVALPAFYNSHD